MKGEKWIDQHETTVGQNINLSPRQESSSWYSEHRAGALSKELQEHMENEVI